MAGKESAQTEDASATTKSSSKTADSTKGAGKTGTAESSTAGLTGGEVIDGKVVLPSQVTPSAQDYREAEAALQADDDARREGAHDAEVQAIADRDQAWAEGAKRVKRPDEFLPQDKVHVVLPEGHPNREEAAGEPTK